ncbi:MAG TPA: YchJ family metal-binding protein [Rhodocyclaceae bacterium]|nr:SEC-C domain-containing protein [Betaproteobacteria bacterium]HMU99911.1 YchJ family metal-binding protein [Rhodocyclaceae bacterium]HMV21133.1 YchJ family metal-binding protein [Rhodocyclaceae bacterium]HMW77095.1 YchJ family metal-binding protein [Rhodocyclaceae bacterium]HNM81625.1 YchJ family metal-binding protein [Rhodocyclaceae bacterium]
MKPPGDPCPCGSSRPYAACCGLCHAGAPAATAEALMRSRYSAYVKGLTDYLLATWHPDTRPATLDLAPEQATRWLGLEVRRHDIQDADHATVEFVARYRIAGRGHRLRETSRFSKIAGVWLYVDGDIAG